MRIVSLSYPVSAEIAKEAAQPKVAAIGQFDGLHQGHGSVLATAIHIARKNGVPAALITFYPHPKDVIGKGNYEGYLTLNQTSRGCLRRWESIYCTLLSLIRNSPKSVRKHL